MRGGEGRNLLDFAFFIDDMLADYRIKFLDLHLLRHVLFVLGGGVEVPRASTRDQFDFVTHDLLPRLRRFRRAYGYPQELHQCRACQSYAGLGWKHVDVPNGFRSQPRSDVRGDSG